MGRDEEEEEEGTRPMDGRMRACDEYDGADALDAACVQI
jgi:hypothetical protein